MPAPLHFYEPNLRDLFRRFFEAESRAPGIAVPAWPGAHLAKIKHTGTAARLGAWCSEALRRKSASGISRGGGDLQLLGVAGIALLRIAVSSPEESRGLLGEVYDGLLAVVCLRGIAEDEDGDIDSGSALTVADEFQAALQRICIEIASDAERSVDARRLYFGAGLAFALDSGETNELELAWEEYQRSDPGFPLAALVGAVVGGKSSPVVDGARLVAEISRVLKLTSRKASPGVTEATRPRGREALDLRMNAALAMIAEGRTLSVVLASTGVKRSTLLGNPRYRRLRQAQKGAKQDHGGRFARSKFDNASADRSETEEAEGE